MSRVLDADDLPFVSYHYGDYLRMTIGWPPAARLVFSELYAVQWGRGVLPIEPEDLRRLIPGLTDDEWRIAWSLVEPHFPCDEDGRRNPACAAERDRAVKIRESRRRGAHKTNANRWGSK